MNNHPQPLRSTVIFGFLCGLFFTPLASGLDLIVDWPTVQVLPLWIFVAIYSGFLTRWSRKGFQAIIFPMLLILIAIPWVDSTTLFLVLIIGTLSWIRSGICFPTNMGKKLIIEALLCLMTGGLLLSRQPISLLTWSLAVWMLFLVQAFYFVFFDLKDNLAESIKRDPFECAKEKAEKIVLAL